MSNGSSAGRAGWNSHKDAKLLKLKASGASLREIADQFGVSHVAVDKRLKYLRARGAIATAATTAPHIQSYKAARRGFTVPPHLEAQYFDLLKQGVSIAEVCKRLGLTATIKRGEQ